MLFRFLLLRCMVRLRWFLLLLLSFVVGNCCYVCVCGVFGCWVCFVFGVGCIWSNWYWCGCGWKYVVWFCGFWMKIWFVVGCIVEMILLFCVIIVWVICSGMLYGKLVFVMKVCW